MGDQAETGLLKWIDGGAKALIAVAIPVAGFAVDSRLKTQTETMEKQKLAFEQIMSAREKDVDLTLKFYDVIGSKRFECFDESKGPLLKFFIDTNNFYNKVKIEYRDIYSSLVKHTVADKECKIANEGEVSELSSEATTKHEGWSSLGRYHVEHGFPNFEVISKLTDDPHGSLPPDTIIKTKTAVYLRSSTADIVLGKNLVLAVLSEGTCAKVKATAHLRGHTWAQIEVPTPCPTENKRTAARM